MTPRLFDSRRATIAPLPPPEGDPVGIYVCGITPYDTTHLGHAFTYLSFDVLARHLRFRGYTVRMVQNLTDVDDDLMRKAREVGESWQSLSERHTTAFLADMDALNWVPPDVYAHASEHVPQVIALVERLVDAGVGYRGDGHVYLDVSAVPHFGEVSHLAEDEWLAVANERGNRPDLPGKRDPLDPRLWQPSAPDEPVWDSPFGPGRPGWHIECSAMSTGYLGAAFTIHGGGADLAFPHHEVERAQNESAFGVRPTVAFWAHTGMVRYAGDKMSKSLGNLVLVRDLIADWSTDALRLAMVSHHYRESFTFHRDDLAVAAARLGRWMTAGGGATDGTPPGLDARAAAEQFASALDDDLDTPGAIAALDRLADLAIGGDEAAGATLLNLARDVLGLRLDG